MKFGPLPPEEAEGALLAHSLRLAGKTLRKGHLLTPEDRRKLRRAGIEEVMTVRPEAGDLDENRAATAMAECLAGEGAACAAPVNGRVKIFAEGPGLVVIDEPRVREVNADGECLALATLAPFSRVERGQVVATLKVLPLALGGQEAGALRRRLRPALSVAAFRPLEVGLLQTRAEGTRSSLLDKTRAATSARVAALGGRLVVARCCAHHETAVAGALAGLRDRGLDLLLVIGASATFDRRDCVPRGIEVAGGQVERLGLPVDPGHLTLLAHCGDLPLLVGPGSARSARRSSFDLLLERFAAGLPVDSRRIAALGVGGLEKTLYVTPDAASRARRRPRVAALVLAAGQSRRMGSVNKLLATVNGVPMLEGVLRAALASRACAVYVVTGFDRARVESLVAGHAVRLVHNPHHDQGISTSIAAGLAALPAHIEGALICLGDMPALSAGILDSIIAAFDPFGGAEVCVPTCRGKRGNPVLWSRRFFAEIRSIRGDAGARHLIGEHAEVVREVPIEDTAILLDVDSPEALARFAQADGRPVAPLSNRPKRPGHGPAIA